MFWLTASVLTVVVFVALVKLGFWQLSRGEEKQQLEQQLLDRQQMSPLSVEQLSAMDAGLNVTGFPLQIDVKPQALPLVYLDNVTHDSKVGYRVLQPMAVFLQREKYLLLVELGFVVASMTRDELPKVAPIGQAQRFTGKVYQKSTNPLSSDVMLENMPAGMRIQNLNLRELAIALDAPLLPFVFQPEVIANSDLPMLWSPYPMTSQKHFGYAFQWFGMAGVYALLVILFVLRKRKVKE
ncbi:SURF1 family protein [Vibrio neonatus]|uniref:SURF1 family protein n=1 Tax=Vibrio neonatus TaxID=278860 RepID=UPI0021C4B527|nr:SURF1 family protein [Vibrio neonatus]